MELIAPPIDDLKKPSNSQTESEKQKQDKGE